MAYTLVLAYIGIAYVAMANALVLAYTGNLYVVVAYVLMACVVRDLDLK